MAMAQEHSGFLNIHKPAGPTSHDVVHRVRQHTGIRRVGHAGTLDPFATGVLVICLGKGTRLAEFLMRSEKQYRAVVELGRSTDTYDRTGQVVAEDDPSGVTREQVEEALARFRGRIQQVPPAYSALKQGGVPFYRRARAGQKVHPQAREVEITTLDLTDWDPPRLTLELTCSAGTYVRSLAHDLGQAVGCGAHLSELVRLRSGRFRLEEATPLEHLLAASEAEWSHWLYPLAAAVEDLPRLDIGEEEKQDLAHGRAISRRDRDEAEEPDQIARAHGPQGELVALVRLGPQGTRWLPHKVFAS